MAISVNTNIGALSAMRAAASVNNEMETSMARLSSGKRINAAKDDAAGVAIASRLTSEIRGTNQAIRNAMDGQALIDTAEGAHTEIVNLLQRMRELTVQSANDTNSEDDREALALEYDQLIQEIDRIANATTWAGQVLLNEAGGNNGDGTFEFMIGSGSEATEAVDFIEIEILDMESAALELAEGDIAEGETSAELRAFVETIDEAIATVNLQRATLGAVSNRLDSTISNLTNVVTNLEAGRGRIEDADFASETTSLARAQILQQASMAMLAQANASKQGVLSLLQR